MKLSRTVVGGVLLSALSPFVHAATPTLPQSFDELLVPSQVMLSPAPRTENAQLNLTKQLDADFFKVTGFVSVVPEEMRALSTLPRTWLGSDWKVESRVATNLALDFRFHQRDTTRGMEVGMERTLFGSTRSRVSYAREESQNLTRMSLDIPMLSKRLSTSFELQYVNLFGPPIGDTNRDYRVRIDFRHSL